MAWRVEKTKAGQDLVWENPELGIAPSALKGTANLQNFNIATEPGQAYVSYKRANQAQLDIQDGTLTPDGATLFNAPANLYSGAWIKVSASTVSGITPTTDATTVGIDYLIVGGGGAGGAAQRTGNYRGGGGGGGAGEVIEGSANLGVGVYAITIGSGGTRNDSAVAGGSGNSSSIETIGTAIGGGGGGTGYQGAVSYNGVGGASGGGGGTGGNVTTGTGGTGTAGNNGGDAAIFSSDPPSLLGAGGGGGGAGAVGTNGNSGTGTGGNGGDGIQSSISGTPTYYGGGGGGGGTSPGKGGQGGGGSGTQPDLGPDFANAEPNTGGGGGGSWTNSDGNTYGAGNGGSGIVIISYPTGSAFATGGVVTYVGGNTIHTFKEDDVFKVLWVNPGGLYYVSYKDLSNKIKLSELYDPYGANPVTHGTTGSITFDVYHTLGKPIAKATEKYNTASGTEYRYYILDADSRIWVYDTLIYETTLANNGVGVTWMLPDPVTYSGFTGIGILNGWLFALDNYQIVTKPTVNLGVPFLFMYQGYLMNPFANHRNFCLTTSQGTLIYTDGNFIGEIFPTTSLQTSQANIQSYASYTGTSTMGVVDNLIGGSLPKTVDGIRVPAVFFAAEGGSIPTALTSNTVYYIAYDDFTQTFEVYANITGGSALNIETGATGTQYFNTFYPVGSDAGADGTHALMQFTAQRVNLPFYEVAQCLLEIGNSILIGCRGSKIYPWNQIDATPSDVITLPESDVVAMVNANNTAYVFAGNKGNIYITNNVVASLALSVPDYCAGVPGAPSTYIEPYFTWGDAMYVRGLIYFSILDQTATKAGNCGGIWAFIPSQNIDPTQDVGLALRQENQNSYGTYNGYAPILIPNEEQKAIGPQYWAAWQSSYDDSTATFGIDYSTTNPNTTAVIETDLMATGTLLEKQTFAQVEYKLAIPLNSGDGVQLYWRQDATSAWTSLGTVRIEPNNPLSGYYAANFQKGQWIQFRAVVTTGGTSASSFVPITEIRLR